EALLDAFRSHYHRFETSVTNVVQSPTDAVVIARLGDDLDEFVRLVQEHSHVFSPEELDVLQISMAAMQNDIQLEYRDAIDASHNGRPSVIWSVPTGGRGRPRIVIDPDFLRWAYSQRSTASIHRFLGVSRDTVRRALLEYGIASPQSDPFLAQPSVVSFTGPLSTISDDELDLLVARLRTHFRRADGYSRLITALRASDNNRARTVLDLYLAA
ncbi:hypothetical protein B0H12DRAFT_996671, partial [Mycena haematopus]